MNLYKRALELKDEIILHRRFFHKNAETGFDIPITKQYIFSELSKLGIVARECGNGICAIIGNTSPCILLRADMDALPIHEESAEAFTAKNGAFHGCGHDMHAAMLLTSAKILKENENKLSGTVKFMFQPAEEILSGARDMIDHGILDSPRPDAALSLHTAAGKITPDTFMYNSGGTMMYSATGIQINITGKGGHAAYPSLAASPIDTAFKIYNEITSVVSKEKGAILTIGKIHSGNSANVIPDTATIEGTIRASKTEICDRLYKEISKITSGIAEQNGVKASTSSLFSAPALVCDKNLTEEFVKYIGEIPSLFEKSIPDMSATASEYFAFIAEKIPSVFIYIGSGFDDERGRFTAHHPKVLFNEDALPKGCAVLSHCAVRFLETH